MSNNSKLLEKIKSEKIKVEELLKNIQIKKEYVSMDILKEVEELNILEPKKKIKRKKEDNNGKNNRRKI